MAKANNNNQQATKAFLTDGMPLPQRYFAILTLCFGTSLVVIDSSIASVALPTIARDLNVKESEAVFIVTIYQLMLVMCLLPLSAMAERIGYRKMYRSGLAIFALGTGLCVFVNNLPMLLFLRVLQSIGAAAVMSVSAALLRPIYPKAMLGRGMALNSVIVASSSALAPTLGGYILSIADWPLIFAVSAPFAVLGLILSRFLPPPKRRDIPYDTISALHSALTFGLLIAGLEIAVHSESKALAIILALSGITSAVMFVRLQNKAENPILPVDLLSKPLFSFSISGAFLAFTASMMLIVLIPFMLEKRYAFNPGEIGTILAAWPLTAVIAAPLAGILSDRFNPAILGTLGTAVAVLGLAALYTLPVDPLKTDIAWRLAFCGGGFSMFLAPNARLIIGNAPPERVAPVGGLIATTRLSGQTFGASLAAALLANSMGIGKEAILLPITLTVLAGLCSASRLWIRE
ncbi:MFS transporter [Kordiimonas pumila]|uniref:MFS transporter n=1 Tax=Kordiimonas pumila TaxID=2161677 RepID=A0ABV7D6R9_9PROT|nr:MFS transporter [Kordiimonas pumila]